MDVELVKTFRFEAAHASLKGYPPDRLHGHTYEATIVVAGTCDPSLDWLIDYADIKALVEPALNELDHYNLNDVLELQEVYETDVAEWLFARIRDGLPTLKEVAVGVVGPSAFHPETCAPDVKLNLPARIRFGFEAAHALPKLPEDHKCYRMHGHSFTAEVAAGNLEALGAYLNDVYDTLDHRCLNMITGLENPTSEQIARWIWDALSNDVDDLSAVVVAETCTARCIYRG